jgi:hypothetical protein
MPLLLSAFLCDTFSKLDNGLRDAVDLLIYILLSYSTT